MAKQVSGKVGNSGAERKSTDIVAVLILLVVVAGIGLATHWPVLSAQVLAFDDEQYLIENVLVQNPGWRSTKRFLTEVLEPSTVQGYYQPLTMLSLMLNYAAGGRDDNLLPFRITNLSLHLANTSLVIVLLYMLLGKVVPAAMAGLLFAVHPMTVEPIPWLSEVKTLLASFFALWCMVIYVCYTRRRNWKLFVGCVVMYILSLMSKPTTTPLPILLLLFDFWPLKRLNKKAFVEKIPLFVIMVVFTFITVISQGRTAGLRVPGKYSLMRNLLILCHNIIFYPYKIIWPVNLSSYYSFPKPLALSDPMVLAGVIGTCVLLLTLLISLRWTRALLTSWLFFFIAIFPTMGIIGFTNVIASDKYAYLPSVGLLMALMWLLVRLWRRVSSSLACRITIVVFVLALAVTESVATRRYLVHWRDSVAFWKRMVTFAPDVAALHNSLGNALKQKGKLNEALEHYTIATGLDSEHFGARNNIAIILFRQGKIDQAIPHFHRAIQMNPSYAAAYKNLGLAFGLQGKIDQAIPHFRKALELRPEDANTHRHLAVVLVQKGLIDEAISEYRQALRINPSHKRARDELQALLAELKNHQ